MTLEQTISPEGLSQKVVITFTLDELAGVELKDHERAMLRWFEQRDDLESKLMALQIYARKIEEAAATRLALQGADHV